MNSWFPLFAVALALSTDAQAGVRTRELSGIGLDPTTGSRIPLETQWVDEVGSRITIAGATDGRPAIVIFADFTCASLCGTIVGEAAAGLSKTALRPAQDYRLLVLGLDPRDNADDARTMRRHHIGEGPHSPAIQFLRSDDETVRRVTSAVGYRFTYDAEHDQFAHPAVALVLAPDGRVSRVLSGLAMTSGDLTLALVEASAGRVGSLADHVRLLCYGFDPAIGVYTPSIRRVLAIVSAVTALALAAGIAALARMPASNR